MNRRDVVLFYLAAVVVFGAVALLTTEPGPIADAHYATNGARFIAQGEGFTAPYFWNWINPPDSLPAPSYRYWQPLPAMLGAAGIAVFGRLMPAFGAAQAAFVLVAALMPVLTYQAATVLSDDPRDARLAAVLTIFSGFYIQFWSLPETFTPYGVAGGAALILTGAALLKRRWWLWFLAGIAGGLAHLTRADGLLLVGVIGLLAGLPLVVEERQVSLRWRAWQTSFGVHIGMGLLVLVGYLLVMGPWFARNVAVFGSPLAPGGAATLWVVNYNEFFEFPASPSFERFREAGLAAALTTRLRVTARNIGIFIAVVGQVYLAYFMLIGLWRNRRHPLVLPTALYGLLLFIFMTWLFALQGARGGWTHSATALLPVLIAVAVIQSDSAARWFARQRRVRFAQARQFVTVAFLVLAVLVTGVIVMRDIVGVADLSRVKWNHTGDAFRAAGVYLDQQGVPPAAPVMSTNPLAFYTYTGRGGIPSAQSAEAILAASEAYDVEIVVLEQQVFTEIPTLEESIAASNRMQQVYNEGGILIYRITPQP